MKKTAKNQLRSCTTCPKKFKGTGKPGHPFFRCPKCRAKKVAA